MNQQQGTIFSKIAMPIVIVAIVVYLICSAWVGIRDPYQFTVAYTDTMETSVDAAGWVVRSEQPVAGAEGVVQLKRGQGEKVAKGKEIAVVYQDETYVENQEELLQVKNDLSALQYATYSESPSGTALEDQMLSAMTSVPPPLRAITAACRNRRRPTASWFSGGNTSCPPRPLPP